MRLGRGTIWARTVREHRRALVGWTLGVFILVAMIVAFYPAIANAGQGWQELIDSYPPEFKAFFGDMADFTTPAGYLRLELFGFMLPLLFIIYAIGRATDSVAGEEERGALDILLSHPVSRMRALFGKAAGVGAGLATLASTVWVTVLAVGALVGMRMSVWNLLAAIVSLLLLATLFASLAFLAVGIRGRKGLASGTVAAVAVASYLLVGLADLVPALGPLRWISPFHWYQLGDPLVNGFGWQGPFLLTGVSAAFMSLAGWAFSRRDLGV